MLKISMCMLLAVTAQAGGSSWRELEAAAEQIESGPAVKWAASWRAADAGAYAQLLDESVDAFSLNSPRALRREVEGVAESDWKRLERVTGREKVRADAARYLAGFAAVDAAEVSVRDIAPAADGAVLVRLALDLRGRLKDGSRRHDRGELDALMAKVGGEWRVRRLDAKKLETLTAAKAGFTDFTEKSGLAALAPSARMEAIRRGGYALVTADYDGDGDPDILVGGAGPMTLWRNRGDGTFTDATKSSGLPGDDMVKAALVADMDNDGLSDLVLQRFVMDESRELLFYRNRGDGRFAPAKAKVERARKHDRPMSMAAMDFNGDGLLDLYVGYPGTMDFTDPRLSSPDQLAHQAIYLNRGGWTFREMDDKAAPLAQMVRPHAAMGTDIDGDGRFDILVVDDRGVDSRVYRNKGQGVFEPSEANLGLRNKGWGMVAAAGDYLGEGREAIYFTNIDFSAGRRIIGLIDRHGDAKDKANPRLADMREWLGGNRLYRPSAKNPGQFEEVSEAAGVSWAGEGPAGATWIDYNNDGRLDLFVMNGLWSGDPARDISASFIRELLDGREATGPVNEVMRGLQKSGASFAGHQRKRLFRNDGNGAFTEVGYLAGVDGVEDGYVPARADVNGDGRPDLVLRNADPASLDRPYLPVTILLNRYAGARRSLAVRLRGADGPSAAYGARVTAYFGGATRVHEVRSVEGAVQSEPSAFFGLGDADKVDRLEVRWPSGRVDEFRDLRPGRILLREGEGSPNYLSSAVPLGAIGL